MPRGPGTVVPAHEGPAIYLATSQGSSDPQPRWTPFLSTAQPAPLRMASPTCPSPSPGCEQRPLKGFKKLRVLNVIFGPSARCLPRGMPVESLPPPS